MPRKKKTEVKKEAPKTAKSTPKKTAQVSAEEAKAALQKEIDQRINSCGREIQAVLQRYGCDLHVSLIISPPNQIVPNIRIVALQQ